MEAKKKVQSKTSRNFLITINNPDETYEKIKNYIMGLKNLCYYIATLEKAPTTGHKHIHIYCQFDIPSRLSLKKMLGAHIDKCFGSAQQNIDYINKVHEPEKRGTIIDEWGEPKLRGGLTISDVEQMDKQERKKLPIQYYNIVRKIELEEECDIDPRTLFKKIEVYYIWGPSEMDKSKDAIQMTIDKGYDRINMVKYENGFWLNIGSAKAAIYDDFRDSHMKPSEFINFIDYNRHPLNVKGGVKTNNYELIIITSVQDPRELYANMQDRDEPSKQWLRRMNIIHKSKFADCRRPPVDLKDLD